MCNCLFVLFERLHFLSLRLIDCPDISFFYSSIVRSGYKAKNFWNIEGIWVAVVGNLNRLIPRYWIKDLVVLPLVGFSSMVDVVSYISDWLIPHYCCCEDVWFLGLLFLIGLWLVCLTLTNLPGIECLWCDRQSTFWLWYWHRTLLSPLSTIFQYFQPVDQAVSCANFAKWTTAGCELWTYAISVAPSGRSIYI